MTAAQIFDLAGKVALVTGASSGLGVRFAEVLAENGAAVALVARRADRLAALQERIEQAGGRAVAIEADVRDRKAMSAAFDAAEKAFGTVTVLINNAGVSHSNRAVELPAEEWQRVISTGKGGAIVNIASVLGLTPDKGIVAYAAAKAGVVQLTKALALELAFKGIRVNAIAPGWIMTEINHDYLSQGRGAAMKQKIPMGRFGDAQDLDGPLLLLASDAGRYMTGATIIVDGGQVVALPV